MAAPVTPLVYSVRRCKPELIAPARPTPREVKQLSDLDDQEGFRCPSFMLLMYPCDPSMQGKDPVRVLRKALAQTLVFYYPLAGQLREGPGRKLMVDCTGKGALFVEADADVELKQFGDPPVPPFPCFEELLFDVHASAEAFNSPLLLIQVTRLKCGGFIFACCLNHTGGDGFGVSQFLNAICEMARGAHMPSISPVWKRETFRVRNSPRVTCIHREYDKNTGLVFPFKRQDLVERSFFFGSSEMAAIRKLVPNGPNHLISKCTTSEILTAFLWRCRTKALELEPEAEVRLLLAVNARGKAHLSLPTGYYGNAVFYPTAVTTIEKLCGNSLEYALELVRKLKEIVTAKYIQSTINLLVTKNRPHYTMVNPYFVADTTKLRFDEIDFGWGKPIFGGPPTTELGLTGYYIRHKNKRGEVGRLVPVGLPARAMHIFVKELDGILGQQLCSSL